MACLLVKYLCSATLLGILSAAATNLTIDTEFADCGKSWDVVTSGEFVVRGRGNGVSSCDVTMKAELNDSCVGLCYNIRNATFEKGNKSTEVNSLSISGANDVRTFKYTNPYTGTVCTEARTLTLSVNGNTEGTDAALAFDFEVELYNNCNNNNTISFFEAVDVIKGFDHGDAFKAKESLNFFRGLAFGLCLAFVWLIVLTLVFIYLRCNPRASRYNKSHWVLVDDKAPLTTSAHDIPDINIELASVGGSAVRPTELTLQN